MGTTISQLLAGRLFLFLLEATWMRLCVDHRIRVRSVQLLLRYLFTLLLYESLGRVCCTIDESLCWIGGNAEALLVILDSFVSTQWLLIIVIELRRWTPLQLLLVSLVDLRWRLSTKSLFLIIDVRRVLGHDWHHDVLIDHPLNVVISMHRWADPL